MGENYGLPYTGSKSRIAHWVIDNLPSGRVLIDAFAGGCAITHRALLSQKWQTVIANDINGKYPQLFLDAIHGRYRDEKRWISREDFERLKSQDAFVACCWSFGNNLQRYMYSPAIEPYKRALHYAIVLDDFAPMQELMPEVARAVHDAIHWIRNTHDRRITAQNVIVKTLKRLTGDNYAQSLERLERLQSLERLGRLQSLESLEILERLERLRVSSLSYDEIDIPDDAVVYCDPPYQACDKYLYEGTARFDHNAFYDWCVRVSKTNPIFISEYSIEDDRFEVVAEKQKITSMASVKSFNVTERLYTVKK
jgi:site-specific DNA-adenine methylase